MPRPSGRALGLNVQPAKRARRQRRSMRGGRRGDELDPAELCVTCIELSVGRKVHVSEVGRRCGALGRIIKVGNDTGEEGDMLDRPRLGVPGSALSGANPGFHAGDEAGGLGLGHGGVSKGTPSM
jgi:hypothetical protein